MKLVWTPNSWEEYEFWQKNDMQMVEKINELVRNCKRTPFQGLGKPEPLKGDFAGFWSRRISAEHRFVYRVSGSHEAQQLEIVQCRFHYKK
jgi:toxin YoeB